MKDPHQNLFYYYGKHYKIINEERIYDPQLENNTTKSLINLFEVGDKDHELLKYFLDKIIKIPKKLNFNNVNFRLQVKTESKKSVPDASVIINNELFIYFENKITKINKNNTTIKKQLLRHWKETKGKNKYLFLLTKDYKEPVFVNKLRKKSINIRFVNWMEIYSIIEDYKNNLGMGNVFINQFLKYLKVIGMAPFRRFEKEDFDVWLESGEVYNVKENVEQLGKKILPKGFKLRMQQVKEKSYYIGGNIYDNKICKKLKENYYSIPHFSIGLVPDGLRIYLILHSKPCVNKFLEKIENKKQFYKLVSFIHDLPEYDIVLDDRKHYRRGLAEYKHDIRIRSKYFEEKEMEFLILRAKKIGQKRTNATIMFENKIPREDVIKDKDIVSTAKKTLRRLFSIYKFAIENY